MRKIVPHLWFDQEVKEAAEFYTSAFGADSQITNMTTLNNTPSGDTDIVSFVLEGQEFEGINGGPLFSFNPSISFIVNCQSAAEVDRLWNHFLVGGKVLMPLDAYPFSERYGWLQDRYGLSWQFMLNKHPIAQKFTPHLLFVGDRYGKAEEAIQFYKSVFQDATVREILRYEKGEEPDVEGAIKYASINMEGLNFVITESAYEHKFSFNESISFMVYCDHQEEIDYYWEKLSAVPEAEACGWLKDPYGISWQIVPKSMVKMMCTKDREQLNRVTQAFLKMKKLDITALEKAYRG